MYTRAKIIMRGTTTAARARRKTRYWLEENLKMVRENRARMTMGIVIAERAALNRSFLEDEYTVASISLTLASNANSQVNS